MKYSIKKYNLESNNSKSSIPDLNFVYTKEIMKGVHYVLVDFFERAICEAEGSDDRGIQLFFSKEGSDDMLEVNFETSLDSHIIGGMSKKTWQGTIYSNEVYKSLFDELD